MIAVERERKKKKNLVPVLLSCWGNGLGRMNTSFDRAARCVCYITARGWGACHSLPRSHPPLEKNEISHTSHILQEKNPYATMSYQMLPFCSILMFFSFFLFVYYTQQSDPLHQTSCVNITRRINFRSAVNGGTAMSVFVEVGRGEAEGRQLDPLNVSVSAPRTSPVILVPMRFTAEREAYLQNWK